MKFASDRLDNPASPPRNPVPHKGAPDVRFTLTSRPLMATKSTYTDALGEEIEVHIVRGIGSSNMVDTDGDVFHKSALVGMARDSIDLNVLLNHVPTAPYNVFGSVLETEMDIVTLHDNTEYAVLKIASDVVKHENDPASWDTYRMIAGIGYRPKKFGFSVGCLYIDARPRTNSKGIYRGVDVFETLPVEFSIVTMPSNRLAWIETISLDLQQKGIIPQTERFGLLAKEFGQSTEMLHRITNWMDFGPVDGPKLEKLALYFEQKYGIVYARMPRSQ